VKVAILRTNIWHVRQWQELFYGRNYAGTASTAAERRIL